MNDDIRPWDGLAAVGPLLRPKHAAEYLGIGRTTFYAHQKAGILPPPIKIGERASGVPRSFLDAVIAARTSN
jgi:predicted DNA-binding transcriptional regulator AlpA